MASRIFSALEFLYTIEIICSLKVLSIKLYGHSMLGVRGEDVWHAALLRSSTVLLKFLFYTYYLIGIFTS